MELVVRPGLLDRVRAWVARSLGVGLPAVGASGGQPAQPTYSPVMELAVLVRNPWVWSCVQAICTDLTGLPLVAETGTGLDREQSTDHWLLRLLDQPSPKVSGRRFRRQIVCDLVLTGNAYIRVTRDGTGRPIMLGRVPPGFVQAQVGADGEELGWTLVATGQRLAWAEILHISDVSWEHTTALVFGASPVQPLALGLAVDRDSRAQSGRAARRGRLEMMLTPDAPEVILNADNTKAIVASYVAAAEGGDGVYVVNKAIKATPLTLTAREGEFLGIQDRLRSEVLAVFGVPPTRAGEPAANYGTSRQQARTYWETLQGRAALLDDELSRLAEPGTRIRHSFANVEALQTSQTERQARGVIWMQAYGMTPPEAAAYEGFVDAPVADVAPAATTSPSPPSQNRPPTEEPQAAAAVASVLRVVASLYESGAPGVEDVARALIRSTLQRLGSEAADDVATEAAAVCREAFAASDDKVVELAAFGRQHADRILRLAGVAA